MARYNDIRCDKYFPMGIFAWGIIAIILMVLLLPLGLIYLAITKTQSLFIWKTWQQSIADTQSLSAQ